VRRQEFTGGIAHADLRVPVHAMWNDVRAVHATRQGRAGSRVPEVRCRPGGASLLGVCHAGRDRERMRLGNRRRWRVRVLIPGPGAPKREVGPVRQKSVTCFGRGDFHGATEGSGTTSAASGPTHRRFSLTNGGAALTLVGRSHYATRNHLV
jgi:hypothetical protein